MPYRWEKDADEWMTYLFLGGMQCDRIAVHVGHGVTGESVRKRAVRLGLTRAPIAPNNASRNEAWTDARIAKLRTLWAAGKPFSEIATALGVSKNTIVGKCHRLGLRRKDVQAAPSFAAPKLEQAAPKPPAPVSAPPNPIVAHYVVSTATGRPLAGSGGEKEPALIVARSEEKPVITCPATLPLAPRLPVQGFEKEPALSPGPVTIVDLEPWHCHWIISPVDGADTLYCGGVSSPGSRWCKHHHGIGCRPVPPPRSRDVRPFPRAIGVHHR